MTTAPVAPPLTLIGNDGSPYSRKVRAVLRYRNIPHRWVISNGPEYVKPPAIPVDLIPVLVWHDEQGAMRESMVDSTPQIARLEREYSARSLRHPDPALAFIDALIEDYADEWGTKLMFHYRWTDPAGIAWAGPQLIRLINPTTPDAGIQQFASWFTKRQTDRCDMVGSNAVTRPVIEAGYRRLLVLLTQLIQQRMFLFGQRPSTADFALYGQLSQLCLFDPTSAQIAAQHAPRVTAWTQRLDDLSGWRVSDEQWLSREAALPALRPLLHEIGATYVPFLLANAAAKAQGSTRLRCTIDGQPWEQQVFPYQLKCLKWLREQFQSLPADQQGWLRDTLAGTGCEALLAAG